jgi:hypothetical protein
MLKKFYEIGQFQKTFYGIINVSISALPRVLSLVMPLRV